MTVRSDTLGGVAYHAFAWNMRNEWLTWVTGACSEMASNTLHGGISTPTQEWLPESWFFRYHHRVCAKIAV